MDPGAFKHPDVVVWGLRMESVHKGMGKWEFLQLSVLQVHVRSHLQVPQAVEPSESCGTGCRHSAPFKRVWSGPSHFQQEFSDKSTYNRHINERISVAVLDQVELGESEMSAAPYEHVFAAPISIVLARMAEREKIVTKGRFHMLWQQRKAHGAERHDKGKAKLRWARWALKHPDSKATTVLEKVGGKQARGSLTWRESVGLVQQQLNGLQGRG